MGCVMEDERRGSGGEDWRDSVDSVDPILWAEKKFLVWRMASLCGWCLSIGPVAVLLTSLTFNIVLYILTTTLL